MLWYILLLSAAADVEDGHRQNRKLARKLARMRTSLRRTLLQKKDALKKMHRLRQQSQQRRHMRDIEEHKMQKSRYLKEAERIRKSGCPVKYASLLIKHLEGNHRRLFIILDRHSTERRLQKERLFEEKLKLLNLQQQKM